MARDQAKVGVKSGQIRQADSATAEGQASVRMPQQMRGQARVGAILDAAAQMIAEEGVAAVAMHALARRARTSIGSLYHFFPNRECVLDALVERHLDAVAEISRELLALPAKVWCQFSTTEAIDRLIMPYSEYLQRHSDYLPLMQGVAPSESDGDFVRVARHMFDARLGALAVEQREHHALMLHAIAAGTMHMAFQMDAGRIDFYLRETQRVMGLYLADIEATIDRQRGPHTSVS